MTPDINAKRLLNSFLELCSIDAEPTRERAMADHLTALLIGLGFSVTEDDAGCRLGGTAGNLYATLAGSGSGETLLFSCHMDRVVPGCGVKPQLAGEYIVSDGSTVLGADDVAGLAAVLEGIVAVREQGLPHPPLELLFSVAEELSLLGIEQFDMSRLVSRCGFVLDAGGPVGEIVVMAPEQVRLSAVIRGRAAHAGIAPQEGVSAIQIAATAIAGMRLLRIDAETTANIGSIRADGPTNIVPDRCEINAEVRSTDPARLAVQVAAMQQALEEAARAAGGQVEISLRSNYRSYRLDPASAPVRRAGAAASRLGLTVRHRSTGGGSDANFLNERGIPTAVLCCGFEKVHTCQERIAVAELTRLAQWVAAILTGGDEASLSSR
ncbi:M20/M25/M40 family metallo-hydrolase [Trichlorobacter lovleyi]|uniref:M20/M25/M40 family metallo-hydrolase n=1 Tax=Trichlorobacter lovleyi TaxID=313985 RepID=UPI002240C36E|nr:M20/M25/M40 family metallo-hydrolase [Trichlorobacter lovleyi]QOX80019.1 M20/M25/M40 family metallo-hydrolase [Trichlorobacter lovleyi]